MEHDLIAAAMRFLGNLRGERMIGEDGEGQGIVQRKNGIGGRRIAGDVVENDGKARARIDSTRRMRPGAGLGNGVRAEERLNRRLDFATTDKGERKRPQEKAKDQSRDSPEPGNGEIPVRN